MRNLGTGIPIISIDFEASCLPSLGSYPIEVAVASVWTGVTKCWIIKPTRAWLRNGRWAEEAQALHGISPEQLQSDGVPVEIVRQELAEFVGPVAVSDAVLSDFYWLEMLYDGRPAFEIESVSDALRRVGLCPPTVTLDDIEQARLMALSRFSQLHHARADCQRIAEAFRILMYETPWKSAESLPLF